MYKALFKTQMPHKLIYSTLTAAERERESTVMLHSIKKKQLNVEYVIVLKLCLHLKRFSAHVTNIKYQLFYQ